MQALMDTDASTGWWHFAACQGADRTRFDPERSHRDAAETIREFCLGCPVLTDCRAEAQQNRAWGVWGGEFRTGQGAGVGKVWTLEQLEQRAPRKPEQAPPPGSAVCHWCHARRQVRADGMLRLHWVPVAGGGKAQCAGSGYAPREAS